MNFTPDSPNFQIPKKFMGKSINTDNINFSRFAALVKEKRESSGLTRRDLAFLLKLKYQRIYKLEKGSIPRNSSEFIRVMEWLDTEAVKASTFIESVQNLLATSFGLAVSQELIESCSPHEKKLIGFNK